MLPARLLALALALSLPLVACGDGERSRADLLEAHRDAVTARLEAMTSAASEAGALGPAALAVTLDPAPDFTTEASSNAIVVHAGDLTGAAPEVDIRFARATHDPVRTARAALGRSDARDSAAAILPAGALERNLAQLARARYALIIVPSFAARPSAAATGFSPGRVKARAHLYDLDSGKRLAAFQVDATNSRKIVARPAAVADELGSDLSYHYGESIRAGIGEYLPGATPPADFGFTDW